MVKTWTKKHCGRQTFVVAQLQNIRKILRKTQAYLAFWYSVNEGRNPPYTNVRYQSA